MYVCMRVCVQGHMDMFLVIRVALLEDSQLDDLHRAGSAATATELGGVADSVHHRVLDVLPLTACLCRAAAERPLQDYGPAAAAALATGPSSCCGSSHRAENVTRYTILLAASSSGCFQAGDAAACASIGTK